MNKLFTISIALALLSGCATVAPQQNAQFIKTLKQQQTTIPDAIRQQRYNIVIRTN